MSTAGEALLRHFFLATRPADPTKAITYATQKRRRRVPPGIVSRRRDPLLLPGVFDLVAQFPEAEPTLSRADLLIGIGTAQRQVGRPEFRTTLLEAARGARELGDSNRLVAAALANSRGYFSSLGNVDGDKVDALQAALALLPDADSCEEGALLLGDKLCSELQFVGGLEQRSALANDAKAMARLRLGVTRRPCARCSNTVTGQRSHGGVMRHNKPSRSSGWRRLRASMIRSSDSPRRARRPCMPFGPVSSTWRTNDTRLRADFLRDSSNRSSSGDRRSDRPPELFRWATSKEPKSSQPLRSNWAFRVDSPTPSGFTRFR